MADSVEGAGFWLPSEFFDDFLMDKENFDKTNASDSDSEFCFPTDFPYDFETNSHERLEVSTISLYFLPCSFFFFLLIFPAVPNNFSFFFFL